MFSNDRQLTDRAVLEYPLGHPPERMALAAVTAPDPRVIVFARVGHDEAQIGVQHADGLAIAPLRQELVRHSPTGLEFGYGGSGPADTALNILSLILPPREAWRFHQRFKAQYVAAIPREGGTLHLSEVRGWIAEQYRVELADAARMADEREMRELLAEIETEERKATTEGRG